MTPFVIGNIQFTLSLLVYAMIVIWYIDPTLSKKTWQEAGVPLLLIHAFRYGPLTLLMPGQVDPEVSLWAREVIAYGDLTSCLLAILTLVLVKRKIGAAKAFVWIFSIIGIGDIAVATKVGIDAGALDMDMGFNLYILNFYVPMLIVSHVLIIRYLVKK